MSDRIEQENSNVEAMATIVYSNEGLSYVP
jgi:hypothetical protein